MSSRMVRLAALTVLVLAIIPPGSAVAAPVQFVSLASASYALLSPAPRVTNGDALDHFPSSVSIGATEPSQRQAVASVISTTAGIQFPGGTMHSVAYLRPAQSGAGVSTTVDSTGDVGQYTSIRIGTDGLGLISYYEVGKNNNTLKVLHCGNTICNSGNTSTTVDNSGNAGMYSSITIGADKLGLISYYNSFPPGALNVFHCSNTVCNSGTVSTVDSSSTFENTSIGIGADELGLISYHDAGNNTLKVLHCGNTICNSGNTSTTVDSTAGKYSSITIGADGLGLISYFDAGHVALKVLHCGNTACSSGNTSALVDASGAPGQYTSITIGADGLGLISYFNSFPPGSLNVFHCNNTACNGGIVDKLDVGEYTSIGIGADGLGLISYYDVSNGDLKVFHCSNRLCSFATVFLPLVIK